MQDDRKSSAREEELVSEPPKGIEPRDASASAHQDRPERDGLIMEPPKGIEPLTYSLRVNRSAD